MFTKELELFRRILCALGFIPGYCLNIQKGIFSKRLFFCGNHSRVSGFYFSIRGRRSKDLPVNQDAFGLCATSESLSIAVSDGLGSRPLSHIGAQALVSATVKELASHSKVESAQQATDNALAIVPNVIKKYLTRDYDSTLITCCVKDCAIEVSKSGDGAVIIITRSKFIPLSDTTKQELNSTATFRRASEKGNHIRHTEIIDSGDLPVMVLAATDGFTTAFTDDAGLQQFMQKLSGAGLMDNPKRALEATIQYVSSWPGHLKQDDTTLVLFTVG